ncbi:MAG: hypothetical protein GY714_23515 [Desulfobacterales bacterium]|nr:hypothetical protein [Desulfobacterales bacterium]
MSNLTVFDVDMKDELLKMGFVLIEHSNLNKGWMFFNNKNLKFNFSKYPKTSFMFTNKLTF